MDLYWIIFLFSYLITKEALIVLHTDEMEVAPNKRNALASLMEDPWPPRPLLVLLQMCLLLLERPHLGP